MGKATLLCLLSATLGATSVTMLGQTQYSSSFQPACPTGSSFKVTPDVANIWHWEGNATAAGTNVLVDINGDGIMDSTHPEVRVCITDMQNASSDNVVVEDASGIRWDLPSRSPWTGSSPDSNSCQHFTTPLVLPVGSHLTVRTTNNAQASSRVRLVGRVVNL